MRKSRIPGPGAAAAAPLPRPHLRLRRRPEAQRPRLPARRRAHLHRHPAGRLRQRHAGRLRPPGLRDSDPGQAGIGVALTEITIGLLAAGPLTRVAAAGGMGLNFLLFLTASWHTTPYFLGPDLVFTFAWLPFVLAGAEGQPALDNLIRRPSAALSRRVRLRRRRATPSALDAGSTRRALLAEFGAAAAAIAGISLLKGPYTAPRSYGRGRARARGRGAGRQGGGPGCGAAKRAPAGGGKVPPGAVRLGPAGRLPSGSRRHLQRPHRRRPGHPDPRVRRQPQGLQRRLHPRRLHGRLRGRRHRLPLPRRRVQRRNRRSHRRPAAGAARSRCSRRAARSTRCRASPRARVDSEAGQLDGDPCPAQRRALGPDPAAVQLDDRAGDRQPEAAPPERRSRAASLRWKRSKTRSRSAGGMPAPSSSTRIVSRPPCARSAERDLAVGAGVAAGVGEQVADHLAQPLGVGARVPAGSSPRLARSRASRRRRTAQVGSDGEAIAAAAAAPLRGRASTSRSSTSRSIRAISLIASRSTRRTSSAPGACWRASTSSWPRIAVSGVRSSCEASETNCRWREKAASSRSSVVEGGGDEVAGQQGGDERDGAEEEKRPHHLGLGVALPRCLLVAHLVADGDERTPKAATTIAPIESASLPRRPRRDQGRLTGRVSR